jgi:hypothetical protein
VTEAEAAPAELPVAERADAESARPLEDTTLQGEIEPVALTAPHAGEVVEAAASVGEQGPQGAHEVTTATDIAKPAKKLPKAKRAAKTEKSAGPREGSKTAQVVAMLQRKDGASISPRTIWTVQAGPLAGARICSRPVSRACSPWETSAPAASNASRQPWEKVRSWYNSCIASWRGRA